MKRIIGITLLCMFASFSFAQKGAVKQAKSAIANTAEARGLIKPALTNEETANDPETWKIAGDIEFKAFDQEKDKEMVKEMTGSGGNVDVMYEGLYNMIDLYKKADELGELPDAKGKIKNKVRKDIVKNIKTAYPFYINGGVHYNDKGVTAAQSGNKEEAQKNYGKAAEFFEMYWDIPSLDMMKGEDLVNQDSTFQTIKYYAVISAVQSNNTERSIAMLKKIIDSPYIPNSTHLESDPYELLSEEYNKIGDSISYVNLLKVGAEKFPKNQYFVSNLINQYIKAGDTQAALNYINQAIKNDPESACELLSVKGLLLSNNKEYAESVKTYEEALSADANCEKALEGLGVLYVLQAQDAKEEIGHTTNRQRLAEIDQTIIDFYTKSLPYLEKYLGQLEARDADPYDMKRALQNLENVYYNLSLLNVDKNSELENIQAKLKKVR